MNATRFAALACLAACPLVAAGQQYRWEVSGSLTDAENLAFAVRNRVLENSSPEPGDLPLPFTGVFELNTGQQTASFTFEGGFTSPTRSYTFDVPVGGLFDGFRILDLNNGRLQIDDAFADFDFSLTIAGSGFGSFSWSDPGAVPSSPPADRSAEGTITDSTFTIVVIPEPASATIAACVLIAGTGFLRRR